ncbi:hypothetical protein CRE_13310 [Caenorhabditis remanei]|uniref:Uncharacterized protein n=1 Tax=Caenorhabditis remanei TaxID=31234 RepID=E3M849_CAERE|nr:hypothetical protein CRE_13310 [Caenorhabditis remanei]
MQLFDESRSQRPPRGESKLKTPVEPPKMPDRDSVDRQTPDRQTERVAIHSCQHTRRTVGL